MDQIERPKRGLGALLAATTQPLSTNPNPSTVSTAEVAILSVRPNPSQPRTDFDPIALQELADSIKARGLIQPIVVRPLRQEEMAGDIKFELIAGERRWRASQLAGLQVIPIVIKAVFDERDILLLSLVENLQRADLNPVEEALVYDRLSKQCHLIHEQIALGVGKSRAYITNCIRILELPSSIIEALRTKKLSLGHAKVLLSLPDPKLQTHFAAKAQAENLTVRDLERLTTDTVSPPVAPTNGDTPSVTPQRRSLRGVKLPSAEVQDLERRLREHFGTRVSIEEGFRKGRILIEFFSTEDLQRIVNILDLSE